MGLKKKLAMGVATGALAVSMIGGGTYAYFNDTVTSEYNFTAGTLKLSSTPQDVNLSFPNIKPGDKIIRTYDLENAGSLDIANVWLETAYTVTDKYKDNNQDFGEHIKVSFSWNKDKEDKTYTLATLKTMGKEKVGEEVFKKRFANPKDKDKLTVQFEFVDKGDQNIFQGDSLKLNWKFIANQTAGTEYK